MAKVKEVSLRERVIGTVAEAIMEKLDLGEMSVTKEGLLMGVDEEQFVVKVIQKKKTIYQEDIKGILHFDELVTLDTADEGFDEEDVEDAEADEDVEVDEDVEQAV